MSNVQTVNAGILSGLNQNAALNSLVAKRQEEKEWRSSDIGKAESKAVGALAMLGTLVVGVGAVYAQSRGYMPEMPMNMNDQFGLAVSLPFVAGIATYAAHQVMPFLPEMKERIGKLFQGKEGKQVDPALQDFKETTASNSFSLGGVIDKFKIAKDIFAGKIGTNFGVATLLNDAEAIKKALGTNNAGLKTAIAFNRGDKSQLRDLSARLNDAIDSAVKTKIAKNEQSLISYKDIEAEIAKKYGDSPALKGTQIEKALEVFKGAEKTGLGLERANMNDTLKNLFDRDVTNDKRRANDSSFKLA